MADVHITIDPERAMTAIAASRPDPDVLARAGVAVQRCVEAFQEWARGVLAAAARALAAFGAAVRRAFGVRTIPQATRIVRRARRRQLRRMMREARRG